MVFDYTFHQHQLTNIKELPNFLFSCWFLCVWAFLSETFHSQKIKAVGQTNKHTINIDSNDSVVFVACFFFLSLFLLLVLLPAWIYNYRNCVSLLFLNCMRYPICARLERMEFKHKRFANGTKKNKSNSKPITATDIYCANTQWMAFAPSKYIEQFMQINCHSFQL